MQHNEYLARIINSSNKLNGNKSFWHYVKTRTQEHIGISALHTPNGVATIPTSKAEILNNTFKSVLRAEILALYRFNLSNNA